MDTAGRVRKTACPPLSHAALAGALLTGNCLSHSSVMFRRSSVLAVGGYLSEWFPAEDYDLWIRLIEVGRYQGVQVVGVRYLENPTGVSSSTALLQTTVASRRAAQYVARWSARPPNVAAAAAFTGEPPPDSRGERTAVRALERGARGIAASLRARHITRKGLFAAPLGASLQLMRGRPPLLRHLCLLACAPRLTLLGRIDRIRAR